MMSNYKVGDLASLMSSSLKKRSDNKLQSLFNEHWSKRLSPNAVKNTKNQKDTSDSDIKSKTRMKKKVIDCSTTIGSLKKGIKTDSNVEFLPLSNKRRHLDENYSNLEKQQKFSCTEDFLIKNTKVKHSKNLKDFRKCTQNKRQKIVQQNSLGTISAKHNESYFCEFDDSKNNSNNQSKTLFCQNSSDVLLVDSKKHEIAQANIEKNKESVEKVRLENFQDLPCTLFVGNLPVSVNRKMLRKLFSPFGQIKSVRLRGAVSTKMSIPKKVAEIKSDYHKGLHSHTGFVVFRDEKSARSALTLNGTLINNHHILVDLANKVGEKKLYNNELSVFIGNLPFDVDDETVRSAFEKCGKIQAVRIVRDRNSGLGKGFGYVQFQKIKAKENALILNDVEIKGRKIRVKPIDNNRERKAGSKKTLMIRTKRQVKDSGCVKTSVKKLLKKGKFVHQKKQIARLFGEKFVK